MGGGATIPQNDQPRPFPDDHGNNNEEITVQVVPPVFADIFKDKVAKLTCKVTNLPSVEGLVISWWKENGGKLDTKTLPQVLQPNGFFGVDGVATVYADEWDKGEIYTCKVSHPELLFPAEVKLQKTPSKSEGVGLGEASAGCKKNWGKRAPVHRDCDLRGETGANAVAFRKGEERLRHRWWDFFGRGGRSRGEEEAIGPLSFAKSRCNSAVAFCKAKG